MSYCRWSSANWSCDLYCYEDVSGGWTTHVGGNRVLGDIPKVDYSGDPREWSDAHTAQMRFLETAKREPIGLPHDGETFNDPTLEDFRERIVSLKALGYNCPDFVLETIDEEIAAEKRAQNAS